MSAKKRLRGNARGNVNKKQKNVGSSVQGIKFCNMISKLGKQNCLKAMNDGNLNVQEI